jgi:hypothetical protein
MISRATVANHNTIAASDYQRSDVANLTHYLEHEQEATLHDRYGREMDPEDVQRLVTVSDRHEMSRHLVLSPENANDLSREQLQRVSKRVCRETLGDREGVEYAYAVHMHDGDRPHAHVVATGRANQPGDPLWLDRDDLEQIRERIHEHAKELARERELEREYERERERERERDRDRDRGYGLW